MPAVTFDLEDKGSDELKRAPHFSMPLSLAPHIVQTTASPPG